MMKKLFLLLCLVFCLGFNAQANQEYSFVLDKLNNNKETEALLNYGNVTLELLSINSSMAKIAVTLENTTKDHAILLFKHDWDEKSLKRQTPKFVFDKKYPGGKGGRKVSGCDYVSQYFEAVVPDETGNILLIDVPTSGVTKFYLPLYLAKYDSKRLGKRGKEGINYTILAEIVSVINISVKKWSENEPSYVTIKNEVSDFISITDTLKFCSNPKHKPSLEQQQRPYREKLDSLVSAIYETLSYSGWNSSDEAYLAYNGLLMQLGRIDLNKNNHDCGLHKEKPAHSCRYCSLSSQQLFHRIDDLYQQLRMGETTKDKAVKEARELYNCYRKSTRRKKDNFYGEKITEFYNQIIK